MLEVSAAQEIIEKAVTRRQPVSMPVDFSVLGVVTAEEALADCDRPQFAKSMMDGFAVRATDVRSASETLRMVEEITAGKLPTRSIGFGECSRIMTGAAVPDGADAVVMIEDCQMAGDQVSISNSARCGQNIQPIGREMRKGQVIVPAGTTLRPADLALLATVGQTTIVAFCRPSVSVLATGDELVEPSAVPGPGQIRNSNAPMLLAQCVQAGAAPNDLGIAADDHNHLQDLVLRGMKSDVLILSGGVSAGKLDLVPDVLKELGVEIKFHKVRMKPGKPLLFGTHSSGLVFGLPGNPVSSFVGFELFVRPAILKMRGVQATSPQFEGLVLSEPAIHRSDRRTYHPAYVHESKYGRAVRLVEWHGSPDLVGLARANALALLESGDRNYSVGEMIPVMRLPS